MKSVLFRWRRRQLLASCSFSVWVMPWIAQPSRIMALQK